MKTVYLYDLFTGELNGTYKAQESPLEPGVFITPSASTDLAPPDVLESHARCFIGGSWQQVPDVRGIWYKPSGEAIIIESLLEELDPTYTREAPEPPPKTLAQQFEEVRFALQSAIDEKARALSFSGGNALMLYASFTNPFTSIALPFAEWESSVWAEAGAYKEQVIAGTSPIVTPEEAVAMMPELVLS